DAHPLADPLVVGVHPLREVVVGDDVLRLRAAQAEEPGAGNRRGGPELLGARHVSAPACSVMRSTALSRSSGVLRASVAVPLRSRLTRPTSVPAGGSSITAVTPSSRRRAMQASQRTGRVTWATSLRSASPPSVTTAPSAFDNSG